MSTYLIAVGPRRDVIVAGIEADLRAFADADEFRTEAGLEPGLLLVDRNACDADTVLSLASEVGVRGPGWFLGVIDDGEPITVRALSFSVPATMREVSERLHGAEAGRSVLLALNAVLIEISKSRHDLNNPLTSALAEAQMLLMDTTDPESRESLEIIQAQLRRMRDLILATRHLKPPRF